MAGSPSGSRASQAASDAESRRLPTPAIGAAGGAIATVAFVSVHGVWIADIWSNLAPMVIAGAGCGGGLAWAYRESVARDGWFTWLVYNLTCAVLLLGLGAVSLFVYEPDFTIAELSDNPDALGLLLGPVMPLIAAGAVVGTAVLWLMYGRRRSMLAPTLVTQSLLMFLVGHNLAVIGLVDVPASQLFRVYRFVWVTLALAVGYAVTAGALSSVSGRWNRWPGSRAAGRRPVPSPPTSSGPSPR